MEKCVNDLMAKAVDGNKWKMFSKVSVEIGSTVWPLNPRDQRRFGMRYVYDGEITSGDGVEYNKFQMLSNDGKVPAPINQWKENNGGPNPVMATAYLKKSGTKEDVEEGLKEGAKLIET
ncbi:hypothetical protein COCMIDRAFT_23671 [Bipolaris oryzae ATCC 44560]|uniref:Uncharacterized protein n=1 Tax=Bipolaris oryzae ATCC 44560 TaxID=930090 RepID=W6ZEQ2_COCMI|nr:uncharacterized protein COCMIDRAFT_23671 [Bipolaris oryzae ATCC 44560]EUC48495.1 hypothetical protein COCMIDRAFT_23671 [Bipolaris oryzae ATCC 44560]